MQRALAEFRIAGVATNLAFLLAMTADDRFAAGDIDVQALDRDLKSFLPGQRPATPRMLAFAAAAVVLERQTNGPSRSPWREIGPWQLNLGGGEELVFATGAGPWTVIVSAGAPMTIRVDGATFRLTSLVLRDGVLRGEIDGVRFEVLVQRTNETITLVEGGEVVALSAIDPLGGARLASDLSGPVTAPVPGKVTRVIAAEGQSVGRGAALLVIEAMKMEHTIVAPRGGVVKRLPHTVGDFVVDGAVLVEFE